MEDLANVTQMQMPMRKAPAALPLGGVEIVMHIANVLDVKTSQCMVV